MKATFDDLGNLILSPESSLERMACSAFIHAMHRRNKPQVIVSGAPDTTIPARPIVREIPGQTKLDEVVANAPR